MGHEEEVEDWRELRQMAGMKTVMKKDEEEEEEEEVQVGPLSRHLRCCGASVAAFGKQCAPVSPLSSGSRWSAMMMVM